MEDNNASPVDEQQECLCIFCLQALDDVVKLDCDHRACRGCLRKQLEDESNTEVECPEDGRIIDVPKILTEDMDDTKKKHEQPVDTQDDEPLDGEKTLPKNQYQQPVDTRKDGQSSVGEKTQPRYQHQQPVDRRKAGEPLVGKKPESRHKEEIKDQQGPPWLLGIAVLVIVIAVVVFLCIPFNKHNYRDINIFKQKLEKMEGDFPNQDKVIWNMLRNGGSRHLAKVHDGNKGEITPLSYHIAGYAGEGGDATVNCFLSRLAKAFTVDPVQSINSEQFTKEDDKGRLDDEIKTSLNGSKKFLAVKNINKLPFNVAQLFMSYSDEHNTVASYPQSVMIVTTLLPFSYDPARKRHHDEGKVGDYYSKEVWAGVHVDLSAPLWSRVGDGLILIREENTCISDDD